MEQAVNQFNKGLQTDTHPMVQSNDTLSDALNATFVTMNGNEVVLQNDMGNRRVDNAYLPSGYEPVGIKEYGGIIYIAAYNPITNRSQIGSFPSPERRISSNDKGDLGGNLNLLVGEGGFKTYPEDSLGGLTCLQEDTILIPLTKDTSLHAGDKFIVYSNGLLGQSAKSIITNYENLNDKEDKVYSPKNKCYTLALGILNSQNEFVDITSSLVRWNGSNIMNLEGKSDLYKFNAGYFIKSSKPKELSFKGITTIQDTLLNKERDNSYQVYEANTYSYKLVGPLYLQAKINHITDFSYNIFGTYDGKSAEIYVEGIITYNCPDGCNSSGKDTGGDDNYETYNEGLVNTSLFDFMVDGNKKGSIDKYTKCKYDPSTNLYTVKQVLKITGLSSENGIIDYVIGVRVNADDITKDVYLQGLSSKGTLDLNKLGSGEIELKGWRFINNYKNKTGTITYTLDAYPKIGKRFKNLKLQFENVEASSNNKYTFTSEQVNNGKTNINVEWQPEIWTQGSNNGDLLYDRALYKVTFMVSEVDDVNMWSGYTSPNNRTSNAPGISGENNNSSTPPSKIISKTGSFGSEPVEFYLTTELFNSCYSSKTTNSDFVVDYGYPRNENKTESLIKEINANGIYTGEQAVMAKKLLVGYDVNTNIKPTITDDDLKIDSKLLVESGQNPYIEYITTKNLRLDLEETVSFKEELYPSWIKLDQTSPLVITYNDLTSNITADVIYQENYNSGNSLTFTVTEGYPSIKGKGTNDSLVITEVGKGTGYHKAVLFSKVSYKDRLETFGNANTILKDCHTSFDNAFEVFTNDMQYGGIFPNSVEHGGSDDWHGIMIAILNNPEVLSQIRTINGGGDDSDYTGYYSFEIDSCHDDNPVTFYMSKLYSKMLDEFNKYIDKNTIFTWIYSNDSDGGDHHGYEDNAFRGYIGLSSPRTGRDMEANDVLTSRIWWRTTNNGWAMIPFKESTPQNCTEPFPDGTKTRSKDSNLEKEVIKSCIGNPHFALYKEVSASTLSKFGPDSQNYRYNDRYEVNINIEWKDKLSSTPIEIKNIQDPLHFEQKAIADTSIEQKYTVSLQSNEEFQDAVSNIIEGMGDIANIDIDTGLSVDVNGKTLFPGKVYDYVVGEGLVYRQGKNIFVDNTYSELYRSILYSGSNTNSGIPRYDQFEGEDSDARTVLDYDNLVTVQNVK